MRTALEARLAEGRVTATAFRVAGVLWAMSVVLALVDLVDSRPDAFGDGTVGRCGLLAGLMATTASIVAVAGVVAKLLRVENEVTRVLANVIRQEMQSGNGQLRALLEEMGPLEVPEGAARNGGSPVSPFPAPRRP